jgi:hypothetical protein
MLKIYPKINGKIQILSMMQRSPALPSWGSSYQIKGIESTMHMIMTDDRGSIYNISYGLVKLMGLHTKFFKYQVGSFISMISLDSICRQSFDPAYKDLIESEGMVVTFDTTDILQLVETEKMSHEELESIIPYLKKQEVFMKMQRVDLGEGNHHACVYYIQSIRQESEGKSSL